MISFKPTAGLDPVGLQHHPGPERLPIRRDHCLVDYCGWHSLCQYLREWLYDGLDKAAPCKTDLEVSLCFAPLLR
jgi:hypothetical protein